MFIYHFNRMIQNKVIWFLFASVVAIAFLSIPSCATGNDRAQLDSVGKIGGEDVSREEYDLASWMVKNSRRSMDVAPAVTETQIWAHIAANRTAEELGLTATATEIRQSILMTPSFQNNGQFDKARYLKLIGENLGLSPAGYERLVGLSITFQKLGMAVGSGFVPSRMKIEDSVAAITDEITFQTATISNLYANAAIDVSTNDMAAYYAEHKGDFALDDRVDIRYAIIPTSNFVASVTIPQVDVLDYYESHLNEYMRESTNGTEQIPFAEVSQVISNDLCLFEASDIANTNLIGFIDDLVNSTNDLESFSWRAKARGYETKTTGLVSPEKAYYTEIEPFAVEEFRDAALDLDARRPDSRYRTARGKEFTYLLQAVTNDPAHTPSFEALIDTIRPLTIENAREKAFDEFAAKKRAEVITAMTNATFEAAAIAQGLNVSTSITFKAETLGSSMFRYAHVIVPAVQHLQAGEVSEVLPIFRDALLANVSSRKSATPLDSDTARERIVSTLASMDEAEAFQDWLLWNLESKGFVPADPYAFEEEATNAEYDD